MPSLPHRLRLQPVDTLRGVAVLAVMLYHFSIHYPARPESEPHPLRIAVETTMRHGDAGVQIFFVISGFVIAYSLRAVPPTLRNGGAFLFRRSIRLDPPYWAALALAIAAGFLSRSVLTDSSARVPTSPGQIALNCVYLQDLLQVTQVLPVAWTLCIEVQFYLAFVALHCAFGLRNGLWLWVSMAVLFASSLLLRFQIVTEPIPGLFLKYWYLFALGVLTTWAYVGRISYQVPMLGVFVAAGFLVLECTVETVVGVATALVFIALAKTGLIASVLRFDPLSWIGRRSYSIYLLHTITGSRVMNVMNRWTDHSPSYATTLLFILLAVIATLIASEVFYRVIELPSIALAKSVARRRGHRFPSHPEPPASL